MCTSIIFNANKTLVGFNLDLLDIEYRINCNENGVFIEMSDPIYGWLPCFGGNSRGDFAGMPTCWPYDERSNPIDDTPNTMLLNIELMLRKRSFEEIKQLTMEKSIPSIRNLTLMSAISNKNGDMLHIIPGQGYKFYERPRYKVLTNFSPFKGESEMHPWMGLDRYNKANELLAKASDDFTVEDLFNVLKQVSQEVCPTVVSMVYDVSDKKIYWCENRNYQDIQSRQF